MASSGDGAATIFCSHLTLGVRPRASMSSVKEVRRDRRCSTRCWPPVTKVPEPRFCVSTPSSTSSASALRTVTREMSSMLAISRSDGSASLALRLPSWIAPWISAFSRR